MPEAREPAAVAPPTPGLRSVSSRPIRLGLVCDYLEEKWASMDLVADLLFDQLRQNAPSVAVTRILPGMPRFASRLPLPVKPGIALNIDRFYGRYVAYPAHLRTLANQFDLIHVVDQSYAHLINEIPAGKAVVTCHDLDIFRSLIEPEKDRRSFWFRKMAANVLRGFQRAAAIICVSEPVRDELLAHRLVPDGLITVVPNGIDPFCSPLPDPEADRQIASLLSVVRPGDPLILHVGTTIARKRIDLLLEIFAKLLPEVPNAWLVRLGGGLTADQQSHATRLGIAGRIVRLPFLDRRQVAAVYRRANLLLLPSESEGFGLPIVEAFATGCPVLASDIPVLRSVGREFADYCPVGDTESWGRRAASLLRPAENSSERHSLRSRAFAGAREYQWPRVIEQITGVYERLCGRQVSGQEHHA